MILIVGNPRRLKQDVWPVPELQPCCFLLVLFLSFVKMCINVNRLSLFLSVQMFHPFCDQLPPPNMSITGSPPCRLKLLPLHASLFAFIVTLVYATYVPEEMCSTPFAGTGVCREYCGDNELPIQHTKNAACGLQNGQIGLDRVKRVCCVAPIPCGEHGQCLNLLLQFELCANDPNYPNDPSKKQFVSGGCPGPADGFGELSCCTQLQIPPAPQNPPGPDYALKNGAFIGAFNPPGGIDNPANRPSGNLLPGTLDAMLPPPVIPAYPPPDANQAPTPDPLRDIFSSEGGLRGTNNIFNYPVAPTVEY